MPRYQFACPSCEATFEEKRSFARSDDPATCPACDAITTEKVIGTAMFYAPGSAAKALLDPKPASRAVPTAAHAGGCPCCSGRSGATGGTVV